MTEHPDNDFTLWRMYVLSGKPGPLVIAVAVGSSTKEARARSPESLPPSQRTHHPRQSPAGLTKARRA